MQSPQRITLQPSFVTTSSGVLAQYWIPLKKIVAPTNHLDTKQET